MAAYRRVYDLRHLQADCQEPGSAPEPYARQSSMGYLYLFTWVSWYQKGKISLILLKHETVSGSGISLAICKSAPRSRQITTPAPHHSVLYSQDAGPVAQPTASKH